MDGWRRQAVRWIAMLTLIIIILAFAPGCSNDKLSRVHIKLEDLPQDKKSAPNKVQSLSEVPECLPAVMNPPKESDLHKGHHHRVFLKWNASESAKDPKKEVVGYCLYRSKKEGAAKENPRCNDCELVTRFPVPETSCVDTLVEDGEKYFYVATTITQKRDLSVSSNEIRVKIPRTEKPVGHPPPGSYPACRAEPSEKGSLASH